MKVTFRITQASEWGGYALARLLANLPDGDMWIDVPGEFGSARSAREAAYQLVKDRRVVEEFTVETDE